MLSPFAPLRINSASFAEALSAWRRGKIPGFFAALKMTTGLAQQFLGSAN